MVCQFPGFSQGKEDGVKIQPESLVLTVQMIARRSEPGGVCFSGECV